MEIHKTSSIVIFILPAISAFFGCGQPASSPNGNNAELPAYIYPEHIPLVDRVSFGSVIKQPGGNYAVLWVFSQAGSESSATAKILSAGRDKLAQSSGYIFGVFTGPPGQWTSAVRPMLRSSRANFPCVVANPTARQSIAYWLTGQSGQLDAGIYVVNSSLQVVRRSGTNADEMRSLLSELAEGNIISNSQASPYAGGKRVRLRLLSTGTGRLVARAVSDITDAKAMTDDLARQLAARIQPQGAVVFLPLRHVGAAGKSSFQANTSLGDALAAELNRLGWPRVIQPRQAAARLIELGLTVAEIEFDPTKAASIADCEFVLTGAVEGHP